VRLVVGIAGAAIPEVLRAISALRVDRAPSARELLASALSAALGSGVLLFDTAGEDKLQIAVLGAAFPQLFSALVSAARPPEPVERAVAVRGRTILDYMTWKV